MPFVNPYTFIPLRSREEAKEANDKLEGLVRAREELPDGGSGPIVYPSVGEGDLYTGVIPCTLETKTKLIIPGYSTSKSCLPFFKIKAMRDGREVGVPAIPGSTLRGAVRSVFESLTDSCMRANANHKKHLHSVTGLKRPGLLYHDVDTDAYVLWGAERFKIWDEGIATNLETGQVVDFTWSEAADLGGNVYDSTRVVTGITGKIEFPTISDAMDAAVPDGSTRGVFLHVNKMMHDGADHPAPSNNPRHHTSHPSVFVKKGEGSVDPHVDEKYVAALGENIELYRRHNEGSGLAERYQDRFESMRRGECALPVWYGVQKFGGANHYQFAWARLSRAVYPKTVEEFYRDFGLRACPREGRVCPACTLFGFVSPDGDGERRASRVRFGDAVFLEFNGGDGPTSEPRYGTVWLPELLQPRVSSFEFYLRNNSGTPGRFTPEMPATELAGRKAYWHHPNNREAVSRTGGEILSKEKREVLNAQAEFVPAGTTFRFNVYVDGVTKRQLNQLLYALTFGEYLGGDPALHCHKIGRAKPYGYGSVHISVQTDEIALRDVSDGLYVITRGLGERAMGAGEVAQTLRNVEVVRNVSRFRLLARQSIHYPRTTPDPPTADEEAKVFDWFTNNRKDRLNNDPEGLFTYDQLLPSAELGANQGLDY